MTSSISCIIGTAGHIDHGKTALVKALTGIDADRLEEEKRRGVTIDIGFAHLDLEGEGGDIRAAIVDVPGHERFIKNMLAGITGIDMVLFAVAADDGIMPQTREHLDIVHLLGVKKGIFVITKTDLAVRERVDEVKRDIELLIKDTGLKGSPILPASSVTGDGIPELKKLIRDTVFESRRREGGFFRLPIDRSFAVKGFGTVVTGTVASGEVKKGAEAVCFPTGARVKIRGIQSLYLERESVGAGERAALNISGVSHNEIERGFLLIAPELAASAPGSMTGGARYIDCFFEFLPDFISSEAKRLVLKVHHLTDESLATVQFIGKKDAGRRAYGRLILKKPLLMLKGDRFILRDPAVNRTVGGGVAYLPYPSKDVMPRLHKAVVPIAGDQGIERVLSDLLPEKGLGFERSTISLMLNIRENGLAGYFKSDGEFGVLGDYVVHLKRVEALKKKVTEVIAGYHSEHPMEAGMKEDSLFKALKADSSGGLPKDRVPGLLKEIFESMVSAGVIKREGSILGLTGYRPASAGAESRIEDAVIALFSKGFAQHPSIEDIRKLPFSKAEVDKVMAYLQRGGVIVKLKEGSFISGEALKGAKARLVEHIKAKGSIKAAEFRDLIGCGRNLAIEVLEYFDKERVTLRKGDVRILR